MSVDSPLLFPIDFLRPPAGLEMWRGYYSKLFHSPRSLSASLAS